jgi:hypothetical protein
MVTANSVVIGWMQYTTSLRYEAGYRRTTIGAFEFTARVVPPNYIFATFGVLTVDSTTQFARSSKPLGRTPK